MQELATPAKEVKKRKQPPPQRSAVFPPFKRFKPTAAAAASSSPSAGAHADADDDEDPDGAPSPSAATAGAEGGGEPVSKLYGFWQTAPWEAPVAVGGMVPKNDRGNVEVPPLTQSLPIGTVHINFPALAPICRGLAIDYAPALVGFEVAGGRMVPKIEGVVVCEVSTMHMHPADVCVT